jgi:hypothetical protein
VALPPVENLPPVVHPPIPAPAARVFSYTPGTYRYEVRNEATIASVGGESRVDTVSTRIVITYQLSHLAGDSIDVTGTVDTFSVNGGHGAPVQPLSQGVPFHFAATISGGVGVATVDSASVCGAPMNTLVVVARDLLPFITEPLSDKAEWQDSTVTTTCRAMIPIISRAHRNTRSEWAAIPPDFGGGAAPAGYRILRTTTGTLSGEGQTAGRQVLVSGSSSSTGALYMSPATGILFGGVGDATTRLIVETGTQRQEFIQQVRQYVRLLH